MMPMKLDFPDNLEKAITILYDSFHILHAAYYRARGRCK